MMAPLTIPPHQEPILDTTWLGVYPAVPLVVARRKLGWTFRRQYSSKLSTQSPAIANDKFAVKWT
jgi:hypothetical protein